MADATGAHSEGTVLVVEGSLDRMSVSSWHDRLSPGLKGLDGARARLDLSGVSHMDSAGAALCSVWRRTAERAGGSLLLVAASDAAREALSMFRVRLDEVPEKPRHSGFAERMGGAVFKFRDGAVEFGVLATDTFYYTVRGLFVRRERIRGSAVVEQMVRIGLESLGIVTLISLLVGLVVALQAAAQLAKFGANIYLVDLVAVGMTREMGPLMTSIILAGRCGSSIAAELSTMVITEEVDALKTMGLHPTRFLVVPRFLAITFTQPLLTMMANVVGIFGGFVVAVTYLDLSAVSYMNRLGEALVLKDIVTGLIKSVSFAWIIVFVGAHRGFQVTGGAVGVGKATTDSVVQAIFAVIVADALFSILFYFGI